ncbi:MAG: hypothetical protein KF901_22460 [Myxococcales bacterium]|nr:hypothetical protein [Myxococcales bacterium]
MTIDAVHVGSGAPVLYEEIVRGTTVSISNDGDFVPVIPGASLKGAVRNVAELLLGGGAPDDRDVASTAVGDLFGYADDRAKSALAARVGFDDALPVAGEPALGIARLPHPFQPRKAAGRRIYGPPAGVLRTDVPYEVIPSGERFRTRLHLVNVSDAELGAVLTCLGLDGTFNLRVGGGKFAGLGRVRCEAVEAWVRRGYESPRAERLDRTKTRELVRVAIEKRTLANGHERPLEVLRQALGGGR